MSADKEIEKELAGAEVSTVARATSSLKLAAKEVKKMLSATGSSILDLCMNMEKATSKDGIKVAFTEFNRVIRIFIEAAPEPEHDRLVRSSLCLAQPSPLLNSFLQQASSVPEALTQYKESVATKLAEVIRANRVLRSLDDVNDDEMLLRLLPEPTSPVSDPGQQDVEVAQLLGDADGSRKRSFSAVDGPQPVRKKSSIPALASLSRMQQLVDHGCASKKQALLTRKKLRSGMSDPRGLLKMVGSSTNALERAKKLEILKSAGYGFEDNKKSQRKL